MSEPDHFRGNSQPIAASGAGDNARPDIDEDIRARLKSLEEFKNTWESDVGKRKPLIKPNVEMILIPSRKIPIAGEMWSVFGIVRNHSDETIWLVDTKTYLLLSPDMQGSFPSGSIPAFFPTVQSRDAPEVIRIDPGCEYAVGWTIDPVKNYLRSRQSQEERDKLPSIMDRISVSLKGFVFFNPGIFSIAATMHVWMTPPTVNNEGSIDNVGASSTLNFTEKVEMDASPWVLILGAIIGGLLSFALQILLGLSKSDMANVFESNAIVYITVGFFSAVLLCAISVVLLSRLATTDFLLVVKVKDIWGAIASGFVIQWFGYSALADLLSKVTFAPH